MKMTLRWYGEAYDSVKLWQIRQIPGVVGVITSLYDKMPGEVWLAEEIRAWKKTVEDAGLTIQGIESVNVHNAIKAGIPERDRYIENYIKSIQNLHREGLHLICYNFMPVFDWTRSDLAKARPDGSTVLAYDQRVIDRTDPQRMFESISGDTNGFMLPGWEPEQMAKVKESFETFDGVDNAKLFDNLVYFLKAIMPACDACDTNMAIHIDDPVWSVFGLPRVVTGGDALQRLFQAVPNRHNGLTLCAGSLSSSPANDIPAIIRSEGIGERIYFAHIRNTKHNAPGVFEESAHYAADGSLDMVDIVRALIEVGFTGPVRPDHGRAIWGELAMPGYGLYDRALGSQYILGIYDALVQEMAGK